MIIIGPDRCISRLAGAGHSNHHEWRQRWVSTGPNPIEVYPSGYYCIFCPAIREDETLER